MIAFGIVKNWSALSGAIFGANPSGLKVPGPGGIPPVPGTKNKCPGPNYYYFNGKCYGAGMNLPQLKVTA